LVHKRKISHQKGIVNMSDKQLSGSVPTPDSHSSRRSPSVERGAPAVLAEKIQNIPIAKPWMGEAEAQAATRAIMSGWITQGPEVAAFEQEFAAYVGAKYACAVSNCTTALHLALLAVGVQPGDEVVTVSHSYIATANTIRYCGAIPVFVDIEPQTYNINPLLVEEAISDKTRAILVVHQMGMPCDLKAISAIARSRNLPVIEDAACAIGSEILWNGEWEKIGKPQTDIACFSFHPRKVIATGDGGMITTNNPEWDKQFRLWRQHGMSVPDTVRHGAKQVIFESYPMLGYNYRMTDIQAAVGREQLKRLPEILERRRYLAQRYQEKLADVPGLKLPTQPAWAKTNWQSYCVRLPEGCDQVEVMQVMLDAGISTRRGIMCAHREPAYQHEAWSCVGKREECLVESEQAQERAIILPLFHQMTEEEQDRAIEVLKTACQIQA
jgi:dTDP-4-amino-4,6-dideoxygalactose transaminase